MKSVLYNIISKRPQIYVAALLEIIHENEAVVNASDLSFWASLMVQEVVDKNELEELKVFFPLKNGTSISAATFGYDSHKSQWRLRGFGGSPSPR